MSIGEKLAKQTCSKDSMTMNLRKFAASIFDSDRFPFVFLLEDAISEVNLSLAPCFTTHNRAQLLLGMYQRGNLFALVEIGIHN